MKLQLAEGSLRVRLTEAEFRAIAGGGSEAVELPLPGRETLRLVLEAGDAFAVPAGEGLHLRLPVTDLAALAARLPCRDGLEYVADAGPAGEVRIVVEVDVRDLHQRRAR